jgi:hypothetical protein
MLRRGHTHPESLDLTLLAQAREAGVDFVWNTRIEPATADIVASGPRGSPVAVARGMTFQTDLEDSACAILSDELAPGGYVYFLVADGQATLATVLFERFRDVRECMRRTTHAVSRLFGIAEFREAQDWGGFGLFSVPDSCCRNGTLYIGEAAGIRNALVSAKLAAQSIIENRNYDELWQGRLLPHLKASVVSRAVYKVLGDSAKKGLWHITGKSARPDRVMRLLYAFTGIHRVLYPFALAGLSSSGQRIIRAAPDPAASRSVLNTDIGLGSS